MALLKVDVAFAFEVMTPLFEMLKSVAVEEPITNAGAVPMPLGFTES